MVNIGIETVFDGEHTKFEMSEEQLYTKLFLSQSPFNFKINELYIGNNEYKLNAELVKTVENITFRIFINISDPRILKLLLENVDFTSLLDTNLFRNKRKFLKKDRTHYTILIEVSDKLLFYSLTAHDKDKNYATSPIIQISAGCILKELKCEQTTIEIDSRIHIAKGTFGRNYPKKLDKILSNIEKISGLPAEITKSLRNVISIVREIIISKEASTNILVMHKVHENHTIISIDLLKRVIVIDNFKMNPKLAQLLIKLIQSNEDFLKV